MGSGSRPIVATTEYLGVSAPPLRGFIYLTLPTQFSGSPRRLCLTKPLIIGYSPAIARYRSWSRQFLPLVRRSAHFAIGGSTPSIALGFCFIPLQESGRCEAVVFSVSWRDSSPFFTAWGFVTFQAIRCCYACPARSFASRRRPCIRWYI